MRIIPLLILLILTFVASPCFGWGDYNSLVPDHTARMFGLKRAWNTQIEMDRSRSRVAHITQHISSSKKRTIFEVSYKNGKNRFSERDLNRYGQSIGVERAERLANERLKSLERAGLEPKLTKIETPITSLFVTTDRGTIHAIDADDGRTRWVESVGNPRHPTEAPAANDDIVAVVNGVSLFVLDAETGKIRWQKKTIGVPSAGPAASDRYIYVPMFKGEIEFYEIDEPNIPAVVYKSNGRVLTSPTVTASSVAWQTELGQLYVGSNQRSFPRFRIETGNAIIAAPTPLPGDLLLIASLDGYLTCLHEIHQSVTWRFSTGEPISTPPIAVGDGVFVLTDEGTLFRINSEDGREMWQTPRISGFLSASSGRLYCISRSGRIEIIDSKTGSRLGSLPNIVTSDLNLVNTQTDRIFLGTRNGSLQCLHERTQDQPLFHVQLKEREAAAPRAPRPMTTPKPKVESDSGNIFGDPDSSAPAPAAPMPDASVPDSGDPFNPAGPAAPAAEAPANNNDDPFGGTP